MEIIRGHEALRPFSIELLIPGKAAYTYNIDNGLIGLGYKHGPFGGCLAIVELDIKYPELTHNCHCLIKKQGNGIWQGVVDRAFFSGFWDLQLSGYHYHLQRFLVPCRVNQYKGQTLRDYLQTLFINCGCPFIISEQNLDRIERSNYSFGGNDDTRTLYEILVQVAIENNLAFGVYPYLLNSVGDITRRSKIGEIIFYDATDNYPNIEMEVGGGKNE